MGLIRWLNTLFKTYNPKFIPWLLPNFCQIAFRNEFQLFRFCGSKNRLGQNDFQLLSICLTFDFY